VAEYIAGAWVMTNSYIILPNRSEGKRQVRNHEHRKVKMAVVACLKTIPAFAFRLCKDCQSDQSVHYPSTMNVCIRNHFADVRILYAYVITGPGRET
jgi:hypothetical protein